PPIKVFLSTLVGSCPLPGLLWLVEFWSVMIEGVSLSVLRDPMPGRWEGEPSSASQIRGGVGARRQSELKQSCCSGAVPISATVGCSGFLRNAENCLTGPVVKRGATVRWRTAPQRTPSAEQRSLLTCTASPSAFKPAARLGPPIGAHWNIGGPSLVMPYFVEMASSLSRGGKPPSGVTAESSTKKPENTPGVVAMRSRASDVVKFWYAWTTPRRR